MQGSFDKQSEIEFLHTEKPRFISTIPIKLHSGKEHQLRSTRGLRVDPTLQLQPGNQGPFSSPSASKIGTVVSFLIRETTLSNTATPTSSLLPAARGSQSSVLKLNGGTAGNRSDKRRGWHCSSDFKSVGNNMASNDPRQETGRKA